MFFINERYSRGPRQNGPQSKRHTHIFSLLYIYIYIYIDVSSRLSHSRTVNFTVEIIWPYVSESYGMTRESSLVMNSFVEGVRILQKVAKISEEISFL
jgi:hypothetical protein